MRILMLTGDAGESQEIYYAKFRLEEEGWTVRIAAPTKRTILSVVHDFEPGFDTYTEKPGYRVEVDLSLDLVDPGSFDALVLPGGRAPEYLRNKREAITIVRHFLDAKKPVAAICHGPLILLAAGFGKDCRMTAYPDLAPDIIAAGGEFVDEAAVCHERVVTSRGWPDNGRWMGEFVRVAKNCL
jgi:protease I